MSEDLLVERLPDPTVARLTPNRPDRQLCRCTGYASILAAARDAFGRYADERSGSGP